MKRDICALLSMSENSDRNALTTRAVAASVAIT
jgi:hypothetical protein